MGSDELSGKPEEILGGYLAMDWNPIQREVVILLISLHLVAKKVTLPFQLTMKPMILRQ